MPSPVSKSILNPTLPDSSHAVAGEVEAAAQTRKGSSSSSARKAPAAATREVQREQPEEVRRRQPEEVRQWSRMMCPMRKRKSMHIL
ncbi:unnamed protein product [Urochloa humidicola]